jgi:hypothetical protein
VSGGLFEAIVASPGAAPRHADAHATSGTP